MYQMNVLQKHYYGRYWKTLCARTIAIFENYFTFKYPTYFTIIYCANKEVYYSRTSIELLNIFAITILHFCAKLASAKLNGFWNIELFPILLIRLEICETSWKLKKIKYYCNLNLKKNNILIPSSIQVWLSVTNKQFMSSKKACNIFILCRWLKYPLIITLEGVWSYFIMDF